MSDALKLFNAAAMPRTLGGRRLDDNETAIVAGALEASAITALETEYPALRVRSLAPLKTGIPEGAQTFTWHRRVKTGDAAIISNYADDLPSVGQHLISETGKIMPVGTQYEYSQDDLLAAAMAQQTGRQMVLDPIMAMEAVEFIERKIDDIGATGDTAHNLPGMLTSSEVSPTAATGNWASGGATAAQIVSDIREGLNRVAVNSEGAHQATTVVMPTAQLRYIATTPLLGTGDNRLTILEEIQNAEMKANGGRMLEFVAWSKADGAGAGGVDRCMIYQKTPDVLGLINPMRARFLAPQETGLHVAVPVWAKCGGVEIMKPLGCDYIDGI